MKNRFTELRITTNSKVFKCLYYRDKLSCPICPPNKGCNYKHYRKPRNWKGFRKKQWKDESRI